MPLGYFLVVPNTFITAFITLYLELPEKNIGGTVIFESQANIILVQVCPKYCVGYTYTKNCLSEIQI